jgi:lipoprotein-releasing system permease protein
MNYETFIALRYFRAKRRTGFISIITYVSVIGVVIGVAALNIVLAAFNGFEGEVRNRLISADAHIHVRKFYNQEIEDYQKVTDSIRAVPRVIGASPVISKESVLHAKDNNQPAVIRALDPKTAGEVSIVPNSIASGKFDLGMQEYEGKQLPGIVMGRYLAESLFIFQEGEVITLFSVPQQLSLMPRFKAQQFLVTGISEIGFYEYDKVLAYISIEEAQKLFNLPNGVTRIDVKLDDYAAADKVAPLIEEKLGGYPYVARTWFEQNKSLYSWMTYEKWLFTIILSLIIMVAAFNIISSLVMIVMEKTREIGILKSMGAPSKGIMKIFLMEGIVIGILGTIIGNILAYGICLLQQKFGLVTLPPEVYIIDKLPVDMHMFDFMIVSIIGVVLCLLAAVYPAYKASRLTPVESIRYE